jgi:hypothetical protein
MTKEQRKINAEKMAAGRLAKQKQREEESAMKEQIIAKQQAELKSLREQISQKEVSVSAGLAENNAPDKQVQSEIDKLREELSDLKLVLANSGSLPSKISTKPWSSIKKPFHKDIFKTKKVHKGYELGFIGESELDDYLANGYSVARGEDYGEKPGAIKRKRMIGVEQPVTAAKESREVQRQFNLAQRTSALQKTKEMSDNIRQQSGRKTEFELSRF